MLKNQCFYFGCQGSVGHYLWSVHGGYVSAAGEKSIPFDWRKLDGGFIADSNKWVNGHATLTVVDGHTVLSFPDNSIDSRPASHSTFIAGGVFDFDQMVELSQRDFDRVWRRFEFDVVNKTSAS